MQRGTQHPKARSGRLAAAVCLVVIAAASCAAPDDEVVGNRPAPVAQPVDASAAPAAEPSASPSAKPAARSSIEPIRKPAVTRKVVVETRSIPFGKRTVTDDSVPEGESSITTRGVRGSKELTYRITYAAGKQVSKKLIRTVVTRKPVMQIRTVGTKAAEPAGGSGCDPNYSGCVPVASDVDCAGGSGNGPEYVEGPVEVTGSDVYGLDRDNDGIGCED